MIILKHLQSRPPVVITDCKSLYDHLVAVTSPTSIEDRRTSIDIVILRQSLERFERIVAMGPYQKNAS